eukprot:m.76408 g.76408  ORF g.76408 m.76408 type:complete len:368 (+) comp14635_c0_seq2:80-1183(+)
METKTKNKHRAYEKAQTDRQATTQRHEHVQRTSTLPTTSFFLPLFLGHRHLVGGSVASGDMVVELALNVDEQGAGAEAEEVGVRPLVAELLFHQSEPDEGVLGLADAAGRLEADLVTCPLVVVADGADHCQSNLKGGVHTLLAGGGLDCVGARHHADEAGLVNVCQRPALARGQNRLELSLTARLTHLLRLLIQRLPVAVQDVWPGDDNVNLLGASLHGHVDLSETLLHGGLTSREASSDRGHGNAGALQEAHSLGHTRRVHAHSADLHMLVLHPQSLDEVLLHGRAGLEAQPLHVALRVVAGQRGQIRQRHCAEQPGCLPVHLHRAAGLQRLCTALHRRQVHVDALNPRKVQRRAGVPHKGRCHFC